MQLLVNPYTAAPVAVSVKKEKHVSILEWEDSLTVRDFVDAVQQVNRALNVWYYGDNT